MTSPIASLTPQNAPRDVVLLTRAGRFALRNLARALGLTNSDDQNVAFMGMPTEKQAEEILKALQNFDRAGGTPEAPAAAPQPTFTPPAHVNGATAPMMPAAMVPAAAAPAPTAAAPSEGKRQLRRTPQNNGAPAAAAPAPAPQPAAPVPTVAASVDLTPVLTAIGNLEAKVAKSAKDDKREILDELEFLRNQVAVCMGLVVVGLQQNIEASTQDLLAAALEEAPGIQDALVAMGKAKKKG